jgi:hypothetical protein
MAAASTGQRVLVLGCGALARELLAVVRTGGWSHVDVRCLPASLHSTPRRIPAAVDEELRRLRSRYDRVFVAYADCGTAGGLGEVLGRHGADRLPGAHCYAAFAGPAAWEALQAEEPGTYYLTDFLARHFDSLVVRPLGLDRYPDLVEVVFGNYRRLVYLAQTEDPELEERARRAARRLGLAFELRRTGYGRLQTAVARFAEKAAAA